MLKSEGNMTMVLLWCLFRWSFFGVLLLRAFFKAVPLFFVPSQEVDPEPYLGSPSTKTMKLTLST